MKPAVVVCHVLCLAVMVHIDWHIGRPVHTDHALGWPLHWVVAIPTFALITHAILTRSDWRALVAIMTAGLLVGQIIEPLGEVLIYGDEWATVMPAMRWRIFFEFMFAGLATSCVTLLSLRVKPSAARPSPHA